VQAGERALRLPPRHVILTYDLAGTLRRKWSTNPWHVHEMAVDPAGNVHGMGDRIDAHSANLVRKYTRDGVLEREFMPAAMFPQGENATSPDRQVYRHNPAALITSWRGVANSSREEFGAPWDGWDVRVHRTARPRTGCGHRNGAGCSLCWPRPPRCTGRRDGTDAPG